jgi:hypothetical protein
VFMKGLRIKKTGKVMSLLQKVEVMDKLDRGMSTAVVDAIMV